jgi:hypothetical protein
MTQTKSKQPAAATPEAFYDGSSKEPALMWAFDGYVPAPDDVVLIVREEWDEDKQRERFEERAFNQRFLASIQKVGTGCTTFQVVGCPFKVDFVERKEDGTYVDDTLNAMWWAWKTALGVK